MESDELPLAMKLNEPFTPGPYEFTSSSEIGEIAAALAKAQGAMKAAEFDKENPGFHFRYATIASIWEAIRAPLSANGLAVTQLVSNGNLVTMLIHSSGQWFRSVSRILAKDTSAQGFGSGMTYSRRYCLQAIVGAASADEDDDGEAASKATTEPSTKKERQTAAWHPDTDHICPTHKTPFKLFEKPDGSKWYSHKVGDAWCNETAAKAQTEPGPEKKVMEFPVQSASTPLVLADPTVIYEADLLDIRALQAESGLTDVQLSNRIKNQFQNRTFKQLSEQDRGEVKEMLRTVIAAHKEADEDKPF